MDDIARVREEGSDIILVLIDLIDQALDRLRRILDKLQPGLCTTSTRQSREQFDDCEAEIDPRLEVLLARHEELFQLVSIADELPELISQATDELQHQAERRTTSFSNIHEGLAKTDDNICQRLEVLAAFLGDPQELLDHRAGGEGVEDAVQLIQRSALPSCAPC